MGFKNCWMAGWLWVVMIWGSLMPAWSQEAPGPWLFHPLEPPSQLALSDLRIELDYRGREHPGFVSLHCQVELHNETARAVNEQMLMVCADAASQLSWNGRAVSQERLVMPMPGSTAGEMTRVSIFHLPLLARETGHLQFSAQQRLEFLSNSRHRVRLILPLPRAWHQVGDTLVRVELTPELHLRGIHSAGLADDSANSKTTGAYPSFERRLSGYARSADVEVEADLAGPAWAGSVGAVPALRHAWLWGGLAALLGVSVGAMGRRGWLWAVPVALLFNWGFCNYDETLRCWTYYRDAYKVQVALNLQQFLVPLWALAGTLGGVLLGYRGQHKEVE